MTGGTLVLGLLNGLTIGLLAVGLVLVYKSDRFLNLAHAQLGTLSALLLAKWVSSWGWSWWLSAVLAVAVGIATGVLVERLFIRPLRRSGGTPVRLLLMSVAVAQVLLALTFIPGLQTNVQQYPQPFHSHVVLAGVTLTGMSLLTAAVVPLLVISIAAFLRYSPMGWSIRAAANNPDAARLCGISVTRVSAVTWAMAGGLSAVSAILQAPQQGTFNVSALGPYLLMLTLGAAAFGAFVSLPWALGGGIVLGVVGQLVRQQTSNAAEAEVALFIVILLVVLVRGRAIERVFTLSGRVVDALPVTRVPEMLRSSVLVRYQRVWLGVTALSLAVVFPALPYFNSAGNRFLLVLVLLYAVLGVALTMLIGWSGQVSLGHFALVGLGTYLTAHWAPTWSLFAIVVVAGLIGAAVMALVGLPALRVGGLALAVTTIGFAVIATDWLFRQSWVGSSRPFVNIPPLNFGFRLGQAGSQLAVYYLTLVLLVVGVVSASALRRWGPGRLVVAVRDNEAAASAFGINPAGVKLTILAVSGFFATAAGVLWAAAWRVASPGQFTADYSLAIIAIPVIGGLGSVSGAVGASALVYMLAFFVGPHLAGLFGSYGNNIGFQLFLAGVGQIVVLLVYPRGLAGAAQRVWQRVLNARERVLAAKPETAEKIEKTEEEEKEEHEEHDKAYEPAAEPHFELHTVAAPSAELVERTADELEEVSGPRLVTEGVRVHFGGVVALAEPDIHVAAGEVVGLIGPNGAGKTTLMNVISGVLRPDAGSVKIDGKEVSDLPPDFRAAYHVARSFQDATLFGGLTVTETIQVALAYDERVATISAMTSSPWARASEARSCREAERIMARFGLEPWADALTADLSTGTRRICDLAAQVAMKPSLLLLDEPTAGIAQREAEAFGPFLRTIRDELDCSVLIIEHDMPLLMGLCDRVYAMEEGRVIAEGTPEEIRSDRRVIASYLGGNEVAIGRSGKRIRATGRSGNGRASDRTRKLESQR